MKDKKKDKKIITKLLCAALTVSLLATGCSKEKDDPRSADGPAQSEDSGALKGTAAELGSMETFTAKTLGGGSFTQEDIAAKDMTIINFWSLMCGPCIDEMPALAALEKALPDNVGLVTVCLDGAGNEKIAEGILDEAGYEGETLISDDGDIGDICENIQYTPTTVLVDAAGNLVGDAIIGGQEDLSGTFLAAVNAALEAGGKEEISLER